MTLPRRQFVSLLLIYCFAAASNPCVSVFARNPHALTDLIRNSPGRDF